MGASSIWFKGTSSGTVREILAAAGDALTSLGVPMDARADEVFGISARSFSVKSHCRRYSRWKGVPPGISVLPGGMRSDLKVIPSRMTRMVLTRLYHPGG